MVTPTPVGGESYSMEFAAETPRTNYVTGGLTFSSAYNDNIAPNGAGSISDVSYSIWPSLALDQSRSRLKWNLSYSPGFTFYQKNTALNQADHNANLSFQYRLSPHVTVSVHDGFRKTSDALSPSGQNPGNSNIGGVLNSPATLIAPVTDQISNRGTVTVTYQFAANAMLGASGIFSLLQYPNLGPTTGLLNSNTRGGQAFYTYRLASWQYIGATYRYRDLRATPNGSETESHSGLLFYSFYLKPTLSLSLFGGPEYANTYGGGVPAVRQWSPSVGGSMGWQAARTSLALDVQRVVSSGNGLSAATHSLGGDASIRQQLSRHFTAGLGVSYSENKTLVAASPSFNRGHTLSGKASVQIALQQHLGLDIGYTRLHQNYANVAAIASTPDRNRVWVSLSYQFQRPIGR
jgi:hypothetical protein